MKPGFDAITIGAGHNGLIASAYLAQAGLRVAVFERRHIVGGAVATEEIVPVIQIRHWRQRTHPDTANADGGRTGT